MAESRKRHSWRYRAAKALIIVLVCAGMVAGIYAGLGRLYHGPRTLAALTAAMPGVPIFPFSAMAPMNIGTQRALAAPLLLIRWQGARHAETALLQAPADREFIVDWYRQAARSQGWTLVANDVAGAGRRLLFLREREGLQVMVGQTANILTPVQLIYLEGLTGPQVTQLMPKGALPEPENSLFAGAPRHAGAKKHGAPKEGTPKARVYPVFPPTALSAIAAATSASAFAIFPPASSASTAIQIAALPPQRPKWPTPLGYRPLPTPAPKPVAAQPKPRLKKIAAPPVPPTPRMPSVPHVATKGPSRHVTRISRPAPIVRPPARPAPEETPSAPEPVVDPPHPMEDQAAQYRPSGE